MTTKAKNLGICMDHSSAHMMEITTDPMETKTLVSPFDNEEKKDSLAKSEYTMHNKEQQVQGAFYSKIGDVIKNYDAVLLFGPTTAKQELNNILKQDHHFEKIKIVVMDTDKMTEHQQHAYVRDFFSKHQR